jgi:hypothetical protein
VPQKASIKELAESLFPLVDARVDETLPTSEAYRQAAPQLILSELATTPRYLFRGCGLAPALQFVSGSAKTPLTGCWCKCKEQP